MVLDYEFKLSQDRTYVAEAAVKIVSSTNEDLAYFNGLIMTYSFTNMHTTSFEMPE